MYFYGLFIKILLILWLLNINIFLFIFELNGIWKWWNEVLKVENVFYGEIWLYWWILKLEGYIIIENINSSVVM